MRKFQGGATRDSEEGKLDYEGFLSPLALEAFARYMHLHQTQADGKKRESDNWQKGMPAPVYAKSMFRHFMDFWMLHRGHRKPSKDKQGYPFDLENVLCAILFNVQGYLHELIKERDG